MPDLGTARIKIRVVSEGLKEFKQFLKGFRDIAKEVKKTTKDINQFNAVQRALVRNAQRTLKTTRNMIKALREQTNSLRGATKAKNQAAKANTILAQRVKATRAQLIPMAKAVRAVNAQVLQSFPGLRRFGRSFAAGAQSLNSFGQSLRQVSFVLRDAGRQLITLAAGIVAAFAPIVLIGAQFEQAVADVVAVSSELSDRSAEAQRSIQELTQVFIELGEATVFTAGQVAEAAKNLALAGFTAAEITEALPSVLRLATVGGLELARAAEVAANTLRAFGFEARNLDRVVDVLAQTATNSNTTVEGLAQSLSLVSSIAATLGQSIEQVVGALGLLGDAGIKNTRAGTGLSQVFLDLTDDIEKVDKVLRQFGSSFEQVNPEVNSLLDIIREFERINLSTAATFEIFEKRAARAFLAILNQGSNALETIIGLNEASQGVARTIEAIKLDTVRGEFIKLRSIVDSLFIQLFEEIRDPIKDFLTQLRGGVAVLKEFFEANRAAIRPFIEFSVKVAALIGSLGGFLTVLGSLTAIVAAPIVAIGGLTTAIVLLGKALLPILGISAAIAGAFGLFAANLTATIIPVVLALKDNFLELQRVISDFNQRVIQPFIRGFREAFNEGFINRIIPAYERLKNAIGGLLTELSDSLGTLRDNTFESFGATLADVIVVGITAFLDILTLVVETIKLIDFESLAESLNGLAVSVKFLADSFKNLQGNAERAVFPVGHLLNQLSDNRLLRTVERFLPNLEQSGRGIPQNIGRISEAVDELDNSLRGSTENLIEFEKEVANIEKAAELFEELTSLKPVEIQQLIDLDVDSNAIKDFVDRLNAEIAELRSAGETPQITARIGELESLRDRILDGAEKVFSRVEAIISEGSKAALEQQEILKESVQLRAQQLEILQRERGALGQVTDEEIALKEAQEEELETLRLLSQLDLSRLDTVRANTEENVVVKETLEELLEVSIERLAVQQSGLKAAESEKQFAEELAQIQRDLADSELNSLQRRIRAAEELRDNQQATLDGFRANLQAQRTLVAQQLKDAEATGAATDVLNPQTGETRGQQFQARINEFDRRINELADLEIKSTENLNKELESIREEDEEKRTEALIRSRLDLAKKLGDIEAQAAETRALREIELERKIRSTFQLTGDAQRDEQVRKEIEAFRTIEEAAIDSEVKKLREKEKTNKLVDEQKRLEEKVTDNLAKQVQNVGQLLQLLRVLDRVEEIREARARESAERAVDNQFAQESVIRRIQQRQDNGQDTRFLERRLAKLRADASLLQGIVDKNAQQAGINSTDITNAVAESRRALEEAEEKGENFKSRIIGFLEDSINAFGSAPGNWADAFVENWQSNSQRIVDAIANTFNVVKNILDPTVRNSPSIVDLWKAQVDTVKMGVRAINSEITGNLPDLSRLNLGAAISNTTPTVPLASNTSSSIANNDNRQVNMNINNNLDSNRLQRELANTLLKRGFKV